ncbi:MAG TPA: hypothetical protein VEW07_02685 [Solirubrobacterales bacterium]|nr:hypothetical protein [Solirubrobacterales bacterium]
MKLIRRHLSVANVISCLALFVALRATAVAASNLGNKAVKTRNLANGSVSTVKLRGGSVTTAKLRNDAVTGAKLADGAVRAAQLGGGVITEPKLKDHAVGGDKIANGAIYGPQLAPDSVGTGKILDGSITAAEISPLLFAQIFRNLSYTRKTSESSTNATKAVFVECPFGKNAISGGAEVIGTNTGVALTRSAPLLGTGTSTNSWGATAQAIGAQTDPWALEAFVVCAELRVP